MGELFEIFDITKFTAVNLEQGFKQLKNAMDKKVRVWWDITTLERYWDANITPRKLKWDVGQIDGFVDEELAKIWYGYSMDVRTDYLTSSLKEEG